MNRKKNAKVRHRRTTVTCLGLMLILIMELMLWAYCRVQSTQVSIEIGAARNRQRELLNTRDTLRVELARLRSPARIGQIAGDKLGLVVPEAKQIIVLP